MNDCRSMDCSRHNIVIKRYILGQLSEEERARLEDEYFADSDLFEELVTVENDLIDSYVLGKLSGADLLQFESYFLTTRERRERVAFARSLLGAQSEGATSSEASRTSTTWRFPALVPITRYALGGTLLVLLLAVIWLTFRNVRLGHELAQMQQSQAGLERKQEELHQKNVELHAELAQRQPVSKQGVGPFGTAHQPVLLLTLSADVVRGNGKPNILPLTPGITSVVLTMETPSGPYSGYDISLETPGGKSLLHKKGLQALATPQGTVVVVQLPASALSRGDYVLRLIGTTANGQTEDVEAYSFRVVTR